MLQFFVLLFVYLGSPTTGGTMSELFTTQDQCVAAAKERGAVLEAHRPDGMEAGVILCVPVEIPYTDKSKKDAAPAAKGKDI